MKKGKYQAPEMEVVKMNNRQTLLSGSGCDTQCDTDGSSGGSCVVD